MKRLKRSGFMVWQKLLLLLAGSMIILALGLGFAIWRSLGQASQDIEQNGREILSNQAETFLSKLVEGQVDTVSLQLAQAQAAAIYGAQSVSDLLDRQAVDAFNPSEEWPVLLEQVSHGERIYYVSSAGDLWTYPELDVGFDLPTGFNLSREPFFPSVDKFDSEANTAIWSEVHTSPFSENYKLVVDALTPVIVGQELRGYVGVSVSLNQMIAQFNQRQPIRGSYTFLMDQERQLVGAPPHARADLLPLDQVANRGVGDLSTTDNPDLDTVLQNMVLGQTAVERVPIKGELKYLAYQPLNLIGWRLGTAVPVPLATAASVQLAEEVEASSDQALTGVLIWTGVLVFAALVVGTVLTRRLTSPLLDLSTIAQRIAEGDLRAEVPIITQKDEVGQLTKAFGTMTERLRNLIDSLEDRVQERTLALETSVDISSQVIAIRDIDELLQYVVARLQTEFNFYHAHIYLIEAETGDLVMVEGSGEVGRQLKEKGHRLEAGHGIVGTVASINEAFLSNNVDDLLNFVRNPLLPDTKSELAVPLRKGDEVLGVLDIQSEEINRFTPSDQSLMQSIANQTAIAIDNARLLTETQAALREVERLNLRLTGEAWAEFTEEMPAVGYRYRDGVSMPLMPDSNGWLRPMKQAAVKKQLVKEVHPGNGQPPRSEVAVPLMLRGQVIGTLGIKREEAADWSEDEMTAIESVANQITLALENARLSEEQAKTIVQLKDVDRLKSEFLTSMSHELRTPLNSIIGFADVILQGIDGELPEMAMNDVRLIHNSGQHLLALINDILDLAKIEAGEMGLVREPLVVADAFDEVLSASSSLVKDKPVQIIIGADESLPPIYADRLRFNQIMLNLVSNAVKFTEEGSVTIKAEVQDETPDKMFISVIDTGIGIPSDKIDAVFDRFRQADDSATTRKYGGTGLGLPICKQLVEMHGGELSLTSEEGEGTTFFFTIPLTDESQ